jgi:uncharacterized protein YjbK
MAETQATGRERELKLGIRDAALFDALLAAAGGERAAPAIQENHFFDSPDRALSARGVALRIRREGERWLLTLKGRDGTQTDPLLADRVELECELEPAQAAEALHSRDPAPPLLAALAPVAGEGEVSALLAVARAASDLAPLQCLGSFRNQRTRVRTELAAGGERHPVTLEFDRTEFAPGDVRHEVELELAPDDPEAAVRGALLALFRRVGAEALPVDSKYAHFLARLEQRPLGAS